MISCRSKADTTYVVALGGHYGIPDGAGRCDPKSARPSGVIEFATGGDFYARSAGEVTLDCTRGPVVVDVHEVDRLAIEGEPTIGDDRFSTYRLVARDRHGETLTIAVNAAVTWEIPPDLERRSGCHGDLVPSCDGPDVVQLRRPSGATGAGERTVAASFSGRRHALQIHLR